MGTASAALRFLVVDDDEDIRGVFSQMVSRLGHTAHLAADGVEAVEALALGRFDYMLLDLSMPRMNGTDVLRWLGQHPQHAEGLRVVVVSAWAETRRAEFKGLGVHAVMPKPLRFQQFRDLLGDQPSTAPGNS